MVSVHPECLLWNLAARQGPAGVFGLKLELEWQTTRWSMGEFV